MNFAAVALGSNLGPREAHLAFALERLRPLLTDLRVSSWHRTDPVGVGPQPEFLNGALVGGTSLDARGLLQRLLEIERERGRERPHPGAPRSLDLDLILFNEEVIDEPDLRIPHPRFRERLFVLEPLAEIAPDWVDPATNATVAELLRRRRKSER